jgi:type IV secretion system protein VirB10
VPRGLVAGIAGLLAVVVLVVGALTGGNRPASPTPDARAREQLERPDTVRSQARGSAQAVDEAAERAAQTSRQAGGRAANAAPGTALRGLQGAPEAPPQERVGRPWPVDAVSVTPPLPTPADDAAEAAEAGHAARELAARSEEGRIFDAAANAGGPPARTVDPPAGIEATIAWPGAPPSAPADRGVETGVDHLVGALQRLAPARLPDAAQQGEAWQARAAAAADGGPLTARPAVGSWVIDAGTVLPAVLTRRIGTDAPGVVTAMISMDVYDSRTARILLLPKGARLVGRYNSDVSTGQARLQFAFTRLILPDGTSFDLPGAMGSDAAGQGGLEADVDRHFLRTFGAALAIGLLADRVVRPETVPAPGLAGGGLSATGQVLVDTANAVLQRNASIAPTLTVDEGSRLQVEVVRDLLFSHPYRMPT